MSYFVLVLLAASMCLLAEAKTEANSVLSHVLGPESVQKDGFTEAEYRKIYSFTKNSKALKHYTYEGMKERIDNLTKWEVPADLKKTFPYYLTGYDYDRRPIWVFEVGKIDFRSITEKGGKALEDARQYLFQAIINIMRSMVVMDTDEEEIREALFIFDMEDASLRQLNYLPSWTEFGRLIGRYWDLTIQFVGVVILINANYIAQLSVDIARPIVGELLERVEVYGSGKSTYLRKLRKHMPMEVIPPWYGGSKDFKPLRVFG